MGDPSEVTTEAPDRPQDLIGERATEYIGILEAATAKMMTGSYRSEDLIDDWFAWWGRAARDVTAAATLGFKTVAQPSSATANEDAHDDGAET